MHTPFDSPQLDSIPLSDLKEYFECPVCYTVPRRPPIFQCTSGHMICGLCRPKVSICPQCRSPYQGHRLLFAERLLERVPVPCNFASEGCQEELVLTEMNQHEKACSYRRVECPNAEFGCVEELSFRGMDAHLLDCSFSPIVCPEDDCGVKLAKKFLVRHVRKRHLGQNVDVAFINYVLGLLLLLSFSVNVLLLWQY